MTAMSENGQIVHVIMNIFHEFVLANVSLIFLRIFPRNVFAIFLRIFPQNVPRNFFTILQAIFSAKTVYEGGHPYGMGFSRMYHEKTGAFISA